MSKSLSKDAKAASARRCAPAQGSSASGDDGHPALVGVVERFANMNSHSFDGFLIYDAGFVLNATTGVAQLFQRTPRDLQRCRVSELIAQESQPVLLQHLQALAPSCCPAMGVRADGTQFPLEVTVQASLVVNGRQVKVVALRDVTHEEESQHLTDRDIARRKLNGDSACSKPGGE